MGTSCIRRAVAGTAFFLLFLTPIVARADEAQIRRGQYLVTIGGCNDCHTPGALRGQPDRGHMLSGSDVGFMIPGMGVFYGRNLTPDKATGLGSWSSEQIVTALRSGMRPDGRQLAPIMPWPSLATLTDDDAFAIAAYLKHLPPVKNQVPGPFAPNQRPTSLVMMIVPASAVPMTPPK